MVARRERKPHMAKVMTTRRERRERVRLGGLVGGKGEESSRSGSEAEGRGEGVSTGEEGFSG